MKFEPGKSGNPMGRPKGSYGGRILALASLDKMMARRKNQNALIRALEKDFKSNPVRFFKTVIMPLLPRESKLSFDHEGVIQWRSLLGASNEEQKALIEGEASEVVSDGEEGDRERKSHEKDCSQDDL
jgi:hypothetical protein